MRKFLSLFDFCVLCLCFCYNCRTGYLLLVVLKAIGGREPTVYYSRSTHTKFISIKNVHNDK